MKKILSLAFTLFLFFAAGYAQQSKTQYTKSGLLWEISGNGLKGPSYLFGTYHFAGKNFVDSLSAIKQKFEECKAVAGEVIIDEGAVAKMMPAMRLDSTTLDKLFSPEEYRQIAQTNKQLTGIDIVTFNGFKPSALQTIWLTFIAPKTISANNPALDMYFQTEGKKKNEPVIGLETMEEQINLLLNGSMESQKKHLLAFVQKKDQFKAESRKMYQLYQKQDLDGLKKLLYDNDEYSQTEMDDLLKNRNLKWMAELPGILSTQQTFIAVGAGHLVGEFGLINQLRLKGYVVKAVKI